MILLSIDPEKKENPCQETIKSSQVKSNQGQSNHFAKRAWEHTHGLICASQVRARARVHMHMLHMARAMVTVGVICWDARVP